MDDREKTKSQLLEELVVLRRRLAGLEAAEHHRVRMQTELERSEADYRQLVEGVNSIILRMDTQGTLTYANEYTYRFFGYSKDELLGKNVVGTIVPAVEDSGRDLAEHIRNLCEHPERFASNENENLCRDGRRVWVAWANKPVRDEHGRLIEILCIGNDITHRKQAEQALEALQRYNRELFEATTNASVVVDPTTMRFVDANRASLEMTGYNREEFCGLALEDLCEDRPPYTAKRAAEHIRSAAEKGPLVIEWRARHRSGEPFWVEATMKHITIDNQVRVLIVVVDVTARKEAEERIRREQKALRQLLEAQERERALISYEIHDGLAQLLTSAAMQLDVSQRTHGENPAVSAEAFRAGKDLVGRALAETRRLIRGLRSPVLEELGVVAAIQHLIDEGASQAGPTVEFHNDVQFDRLDPALENALFRIAQEGLTNARRYSQSDVIRVELVERGGQIVLTVRDEGVGVDLEQVGAESFGLRGIRERARVLGGHATIESQPGRGTTVRAELPIDPPWAETHNGEDT